MRLHKGGGGGVETYHTLMICVSYSQVGENEPFVSELLTGLPTTIADLEPHQIHTFYESVCILYVLTKSVNRGFMLDFTVSFYFFIFRLVTWYKRNLIPRSGMNTFRGWWSSQIRFILIWNLLVQLSLLCAHTHTHTQTICTRCLPSLWLKLLHAFSFDAEMGWDHRQGASKCWFPEGSRRNPDCA